jgi:hypothetical protein
MAFTNCSTCPTPAKCREAGKCLNKKKVTKKMSKKDPRHPMNAERTTGGSYD